MKRAILLLTLAVLLSAAAAAEESGVAADAGNTGLYFDAADGVWIGYDGTQETHSSESGQSPAAQTGDETGFLSGYIRIPRGRALYRDVNRTEQLGYPLEESVFYAVRRRKYEKGAVYELRFDTAESAETDRYVTAYYYSRDPDAVSEGGQEELFAGMAGARIVDGVPLTLVRLRYGEAPGESVEERYNVVSASGVALVKHDETNLREGPGGTYGYIVRLSRGEAVTVEGMTVNGVGATWMLVKDRDGNEGFIRADLLGAAPEATPEPTAVPTPDPTPEPTPTPQPTAVPSPTPEPEHRVSVAVRGKAEPAIGDTVVLEAVLEGYGDLVTRLQWQASRDGETWQDIAGATADTLSVTLTQENSGSYWRVLVTHSEPEIAQPRTD
ncbi:MAG: SH3 domain-containing protein [Clostridia bacterium]|nr:SH3 domain-containing protein [Clostridia bacterium]